MIDLHCHILPGIDDGAVDLEDAVAMAAQADADGIASVCATPHIRHDHRVSIAALPRQVEALNGELHARGHRVRVLLGGEVAETELAVLGDRELSTVTLGAGRWILLEPAPGPLGESLVEAARQLSSRGFGSIVAHPERHHHPDAPALLAGLAAEGALVQVTAAFVEHPATAPTVLELAEHGLIHLLGSDAHTSHAGRTVTLSGGVAALRSIPALAPHVPWIAEEAPRAIVSGDPVVAPFGPFRPFRPPGPPA